MGDESYTGVVGYTVAGCAVVSGVSMWMDGVREISDDRTVLCCGLQYSSVKFNGLLLSFVVRLGGGSRRDER